MNTESLARDVPHAAPGAVVALTASVDGEDPPSSEDWLND